MNSIDSPKIEEQYVLFLKTMLAFYYWNHENKYKSYELIQELIHIKDVDINCIISTFNMNLEFLRNQIIMMIEEVIDASA